MFCGLLGSIGRLWIGNFGATLVSVILSIGYIALWKFNEADQCIADALALVDTSKQNNSEVEVYRVLGELIAQSGERRCKG
jgi:hypothetical protein